MDEKSLTAQDLGGGASRVIRRLFLQLKKHCTKPAAVDDERVDVGEHSAQSNRRP